MTDFTQILKEFTSQAQIRYGKDFFIDQKNVGDNIKIILLTVNLQKQLEQILKNNKIKNVTVSSIEVAEGIEVKIKSGFISVFTKRSTNLKYLADQLIEGDRFRVYDQAEKGVWVPVKIHHDFENVVNKQLGWIQYDPEKIITNNVTSNKLYKKVDYKKLIEQYLSKNSHIKYLYAGKTKEMGIDCSGFTQIIYKKLYNKLMPRVSSLQAKLGTEITKDKLEPTDLVYFYNTKRGRVTHCGLVYDIQEGKLPIIVHSSQKAKGITLDDLNNPKYVHNDCVLGGFRRI
jgi:hypothetical protein